MAWLVVTMTALLGVRSVLADSPILSKTEELRQKLLKNYDKNALPQRDTNGTTTAYFGIIPMGMWIEEDKQVFNLNAWLRMTWKDPRLAWDYKDFAGIKSVHFDDSELWHPEAHLYNNADITDVNHYGSVKSLVYSDGMVLWVPPGLFRSECPLDATHWPYDTQTCELYIGAWAYHGWHVDLQLFHNASKVLPGWFMKFSHSWQYVKGSIERIQTTYSCCPEPYVMIRVEITMSRVSPIFTSTVVIPACVISVLTLVQFLLPLREPRRLTLGCVSLLLTLIVLLYLAISLPHLAFSLPIIVKFYGQTLAVIVVSVGVNAGLLRLTDGRQPSVTSTPPPALLKNILTGPLASVLCLQRYAEKVGLSGGGAEDGEVLEETRPASYLHEWLLVAAALDRLAAITFVAAFVITLIAYVAPV
nr:neuronal acetylcholine receptor subunit alpha-7-like [Procambarus clarkii]